MSNNIDHLFKKALQNRSEEPPAYIWKNIQTHLGRKRNIGVWWLRGVAAAALLAAVIGIWELRRSNENSPMAENAIFVIPATNGNLIFGDRPAPVEFVSNDAVPTIIEKEVSFAGQLKEAKISSSPAQTYHLAVTEKIPNHFSVPGLKKNVIRKDFIPLTSEAALRNNIKYQSLLNADAVEAKQGKEKVRIELSGHFIPGYSSGSYSSSIKNPQGNSYSSDQMEGLMNAGGGLRVAFSTSKRLSWQTGVFYSRMGQKTAEHQGNARTLAYSLNDTENRRTTPLGNIRNRRKTSTVHTSEALMLAGTGNTNSSETLEQTFGTIEIPLQLRYRLNDNKVLFSLVGGFSGNIIVSNKVYLETESKKELLGSTEDIRNFNMSTDWGLGMEYPLNRNIKIMVEPGFKYYLQSLSRNNDIDFKPYMFTLSTGIGIQF